MGRHSAPDGAAVHPVVAAALTLRTEDTAAGRRGQLRADATESGLGWPGESTTHEGLGWPGGTSSQDRATGADAPRRGWRRFFRAA